MWTNNRVNIKSVIIAQVLKNKKANGFPKIKTMFFFFPSIFEKPE